MKNYVLKIEKKSFKDKNDENKEIVYFEMAVEIDGTILHLGFKEQDKKLGTYLLKKHNYNDKGEIID